MKNSPKLEDLDVLNKTGIVRVDLDAVLDDEVEPRKNLRLLVIKPTVDYLFQKGASSLILIAHYGRPEGKFVPELSLKSLVQPLKDVLERDIFFIDSLNFDEIMRLEEEKKGNQSVFLLENLRFWPGEESNDINFAKNLASLSDFYVNEAFASSHREHASIVSLPKLLPSTLGLRFEKEVENLSRLFDSQERPVLIIVSGTKKDKLSYLDGLSKVANMVLIGGRFPDYLPDDSIYRRDNRFLVARLNPDKEDITIHSIEDFEREIKRAKTIALIGPIGKYEEEGHRLGTKRVFEAVADSSAFKIAGGGDTIKAIEMFGIASKFDWISVGGGAVLEFLTKRTLPGIEAIVCG